MSKEALIIMNSKIGKWLTPDKNLYYFLVKMKECTRVSVYGYEITGLELYSNTRSLKWQRNIKNNFISKVAFERMWTEDDARVISRLQKLALRTIFKDKE